MIGCHVLNRMPASVEQFRDLGSKTRRQRQLRRPSQALDQAPIDVMWALRWTSSVSSRNVTLSRAQVEGSLAFILMRVPEAEVRLVGTASSAMRGIELPANDLDILFHDRSGLDSWFGVLSAHLDVGSAPAWITDSQQYFARIHDGDVTIELSTVEIESDADTMECFGEGPWRYFDLVPCGSRTVPAVATELRLITEVSRGRTDRYRPIVDHLRQVGCDVGLIRRGLAHAGVEQDATVQIIAELSPGDRL
jgi:hypothetical protein